MNARSCFRHVAAIASLVLVSACTFVSDAEVARVSGAIGGSVTGSEVSRSDRDPAVLGALLSRINGDEVDEALVDEDKRLMAELVFVVLDHGADGDNKTWRNRYSRHHGSFTAHSTWRTSESVECRRFTNTIYVGEVESRANGTACRQRDGTWSVMG